MKENKFIRRVVKEVDRGNLFKVLLQLPYSEKYETGGYITNAGIYYRKGSKTNIIIPPEKAVSFHTHIESQYSEVFSELDILNFLFSDSYMTILSTPETYFVIEKTDKTYSFIKLWDNVHDDNILELSYISANMNPIYIFYYLLRECLEKSELSFNVTNESWPIKWKYVLIKIMGMNINSIPKSKLDSLIKKQAAKKAA